MTELRVVAFAGSLRRHSFNRALLRAAGELAPEGMRIEEIAVGELPFFDADVEAAGDPAGVAAFKAALREADAVLIATPEYNDGIPGVLTNAIDWGSRLPGGAPLTEQPVALMGASPSQIGTARAQLHLRQILTHATTRRVFESLLERFARWIGREHAAAEAERALATTPAAHP